MLPPAPYPLNYAFPASIRWQTKPADLATYLTDAVGYFSDEIFDVWRTVSGVPSLLSRFKYHFGCSGGLYYLQGLFTPDSPSGYPGSFQMLTWLPPIGGSTCSPFHMKIGTTFNDGLAPFRDQGITVDCFPDVPPPPVVVPPGAGLGQGSALSLGAGLGSVSARNFRLVEAPLEET
jgi:hypothetical protein